RFGESFAHPPERGPQSEDIWPHENPGRCAARRVQEVAVRGAVRRGHLYVSVSRCHCFGDLGQRHRAPGGQHDTELLPCHEATSLVLLPVLSEMILIAHSPSLSPPSCAIEPHAYRAIILAPSRFARIEA